jgi:hypothetical protein
MIWHVNANIRGWISYYGRYYKSAFYPTLRHIGVWGNTDEGRHILIAVARYLAAHSPTERSGLQIAVACPCTAMKAPIQLAGGGLSATA